MSTNDQPSIIIGAQALGSQLPGIDPFIFGAYHQDHYPRGNGRLGPDSELLKGREIGMDFSGKDGFSMYHGDTVPGFPAHPHRGFETVTIVRKGLVDHADSLGATARYGEGDVQWLTTGSGVQHGEMFPMVHENKDNTLDLFQIWLNLPAKRKMAKPDFTMFWAHDIPHVVLTDAQGRRSEVEVVAGDYAPADAAAAGGQRLVKALPPPPDSWASEPGADVAIWIIRIEPGASLVLPGAGSHARRALYLTTGSTLTVDGHRFDQRVMVEVRPDLPAPLRNEGDEVVEVLLLQGKPIAEPVAAHGPIVMNTQQEVAQAFRDYQRTEFGGWPWPSHAHTHGKEKRFARHPDGRVEKPRD
ncbi:pirin family protein [Diaphorobacter ruginosibacter]|uniref:Pirin family protein n=1 Tax=Diaphorobacter ruginosibacter TaxID=1715720 RepID=A0A7G9RSK4_9BURK|nr:pirin family protein [Diaphorobacter ruginosibacter]QNN58579.1 pirin family protein [Diaphorobacter ruginosibacter]